MTATDRPPAAKLEPELERRELVSALVVELAQIADYAVDPLVVAWLTRVAALVHRLAVTLESANAPF